MSRITAYPGKVVPLLATFLDEDGQISPQPVGYPKVSVDRIENENSVPVLTNDTMVNLASGTAVRDFICPNELGAYKVTYTGQVGGELVFGEDIIDVFDLKLFLKQFDVKQRFTYTLNRQVASIFFDYGNPIVKTVEMKFDYLGDGTVNTLEVKEF